MKIDMTKVPQGAMDCFRECGDVIFFDNCRRNMTTKKDVKALTKQKALDYYKEQDEKEKFLRRMRADLGEARLDDMASWCGAVDQSSEYNRLTAAIAHCRRFKAWAEDAARAYFKWSHPGHVW